MDALTALVCIVALLAFLSLIIVALHLKGDLKASARVGPSSFSVEVREKEQRPHSRAELKSEQKGSARVFRRHASPKKRRRTQ